MVRFVVRRMVALVAVMFVISVGVFALFFTTPGADPAARIAGRGASQDTLSQVRASFGLDRSLPVQYGLMMRALFIDRDLTSFVNRGTEVVPQVISAAPVTLSLVSGAGVLWVAGALGAGLLATRYRGTWVDRAVMVLGVAGVSVPVYWLGAIVVLVTQGSLHDPVFTWVPPLGYAPLRDGVGDWALHLLLPWLTLAVLYCGIYALVLRSELAHALAEDYVRTARAKGLSEPRVLTRHALRSSLVAFVSLLGLDVGALVGGSALLIEVVFGLPGIGRLTYDALRTLDLPMILATVMYATFFVVVVNAVMDVVHAWLDPTTVRS